MLLSLLLPCTQSINTVFNNMRGFDIVKIDPIIDFFNIMTYDIHGTWDSSDNWIGAIAQAHTNLTEIELSMQLL